MILEAILGTLVTLVIGTPLVIIFDKWKKEERANDRERTQRNIHL